MKHIYTGLLSEHSYGEADDVLFISNISEPLAEELEWMCSKCVSVRYWITDVQVTREEAQDAFLKTMFGNLDVEFNSRYSECTGYLWTDENLKVGGHDLLAELRSSIGKWLILEIDVN